MVPPKRSARKLPHLVLLRPPLHSPSSVPSLLMTGLRFESIPSPASTTTGADHGPAAALDHDIQVWSLDRPPRSMPAPGGVEPSPSPVQLAADASPLNAGLQLPGLPAAAAGSQPV